MRLPRVRFTVRRMMVAVAVAALVLLVASNEIVMTELPTSAW